MRIQRLSNRNMPKEFDLDFLVGLTTNVIPKPAKIRQTELSVFVFVFLLFCGFIFLPNG